MDDHKRDAIEQPDANATRQPHPAGPHAAPELTDFEKTPGSGMLPEADDPNMSPTS
jgi:hypothetical protein